MGLFDFLKPKRKTSWYYTEAEVDICEAYIEKCYGKIETYFHEIVSPDIHLDIALIPPSEEMPVYKLVTVGMGAYSMNVPKELRNSGIDRAELVIFLPPDWNVKSSDENDYWPIRNMKILGRYPLHNDTWLGVGHTIISQDGKPYAENTKLNGTLLLTACDMDSNPMKITLPGGKQVCFLQIIPLYQEEMDFKLTNSANALLELFDQNQIDIVVDIKRKNCCL